MAEQCITTTTKQQETLDTKELRNKQIYFLYVRLLRAYFSGYEVKEDRDDGFNEIITIISKNEPKAKVSVGFFASVDWKAGYGYSKSISLILTDDMWLCNESLESVLDEVRVINMSKIIKSMRRLINITLPTIWSKLKVAETISELKGRTEWEKEKEDVNN